MSTIPFISSNINKSRPAPNLLNTNVEELIEIKSRKRISTIITWIVGLLLISGSLGLILGLISPAFVYISNNSATETPIIYSNTTSITSTSIIGGTSVHTVSSITVSNTASTVSSTNAVTCPSGYSRSPSGICVNLLIDFNNCGSFGYVCPSNYTSYSAGICSRAPAVQIIGGVSIPGWGGSTSLDDAYVTLNLPVALTLYNYSTTNVSVSTNGVVCLGACSANYSNGNLPTIYFGGPTALGYWDDLMIYSNTSQSVYFNVLGVAPNRTTTFEFYEAHFNNPTAYYHFQIIFQERLPNIVKYVYFQSSDGGSSATIGVQASSFGPSITYSVNQANSVTNNMTLIFNTNTGTFTG